MNNEERREDAINEALPDADAVKIAMEWKAEAAKVASEWKRLYYERDRLWRKETDRVDAVRMLLEANGCDCDCEHHHDEHDADCDRCLACRISWALRGGDNE